MIIRREAVIGDSILARYAAARVWLDTLAAIVRAAREALPSESSVFGDRDVDAWFAELAAYQHVTCQRCGTMLEADVLGPAAYTAPPFARICGDCYAGCATDSSSWRRHARLAAFAAERPDLLAGVVVDAQTRLGLDDWRLERSFRLDATGIVRLILCPQLRPGGEDEDLAWIASHVGTDLERLRSVLRGSLNTEG